MFKITANGQEGLVPYFKDGNIELYHNSFENVLGLPIADLILTDPPYSKDTHKNARTNRGGTGRDGKPSIEFAPITSQELREYLTFLGKHTRRWLIATLDWRHVAEFEKEPLWGLTLKRFGVWLKPNPMPQISGDRPATGWEAIAYFHRAEAPSRWNAGGCHGNYYLEPGSDTAHPTEKPVSMYRSIIERFTEPGDLVLDPFCGSGTSLIAARDMGRKAIGIEKEKEFCDMAVRRLSQRVFSFAWPRSGARTVLFRTC